MGMRRDGVRVKRRGLECGSDAGEKLDVAMHTVVYSYDGRVHMGINWNSSRAQGLPSGLVKSPTFSIPSHNVQFCFKVLYLDLFPDSQPIHSYLIHHLTRCLFYPPVLLMID